MRRSSCTARDRQQHVICGQGVAPRRRRSRRFAALGLDLIPGTGLLPAVVPGAFDAWCLCCATGAPGSCADVLAFAIGYARNGVHWCRASGHDRERAPAVRDGVEKLAPRCSCPAAMCRRRAACSPARRSPPPTSASAAKPTGGTREARIDAARAPGIAASSPRRSTVLPRHEVLDVTGRRHRGLLTADDLRLWSARSRIPSPTTTTATRC